MITKIIYSVLITLFISLPVLSQDDSILQLFPGKWKMDTDKAEIYEEWIVSNGTELTGKSFSVVEGEEIVSEILYLKKFGEQWAYVAVPEGQNIALFALIEYTPKQFIFENEEHDFPQRINYEFHKGGKLTATVEGLINGEIKRREFSLTLVDE